MQRPLEAERDHDQQPARKWGLSSCNHTGLNVANTGMSKETDSSLDPWERMHPCRHLDFKLVKTISDSSTEVCNGIFVLLKAIRSMAICYGDTRKLTLLSVFMSLIAYCTLHSVLTPLRHSCAFMGSCAGLGSHTTEVSPGLLKQGPSKSLKSSIWGGQGC